MTKPAVMLPMGEVNEWTKYGIAFRSVSVPTVVDMSLLMTIVLYSVYFMYRQCNALCQGVRMRERGCSSPIRNS